MNNTNSVNESTNQTPSHAFELIMEGLREARDYLDGKPINVDLTEIIITEVKSPNSVDVKKLHKL